MRSRIFHILMALWWSLFTLIIIPGHTRGAIPLATRGATCPFCAPPPPCCQNNPIPNKPPQQSSANCSICYLVAVLTTTPILPIFVVRFTMIARSAPEIARIPLLDDAPLSILCRGPPAC